MNWKNWLLGLVWAVVTGMGSGVTMMIADPSHFNFGAEWKSLLGVMAAFGLLAFFAYIKDSRPPSFTDKVLDSVKDHVSVGVILFAVLLGGSALATSACLGPKNVVLTPAGQKAYTAKEAIKATNAFAATARNLNKSVGKDHLSDKNLEIVRVATVTIGPALADYGLGKGPLTTAIDAYHVMVKQLTPDAKLNDKFRYALGVLDGVLNNVSIPPTK